MDKFGIFKLLNSFFNFLGQKQSASATDFNAKNSGETNTSNGNTNGGDIVSNLLKSLSANNAQNQQHENNEHKKEKIATRPLQADMLKTMNSHEEFIRRVKQKNP